MKGLYVAIPTVNKKPSGLFSRLSNDFFFFFYLELFLTKPTFIEMMLTCKGFWLRTKSTLLHSDWLMHCGMLDSPIKYRKMNPIRISFSSAIRALSKKFWFHDGLQSVLTMTHVHVYEVQVIFASHLVSKRDKI